MRKSSLALRGFSTYLFSQKLLTADQHHSTYRAESTTTQRPTQRTFWSSGVSRRETALRRHGQQHTLEATVASLSHYVSSNDESSDEDASEDPPSGSAPPPSSSYSSAASSSAPWSSSSSISPSMTLTDVRAN